MFCSDRIGHETLWRSNGAGGIGSKRNAIVEIIDDEFNYLKTMIGKITESLVFCIFVETGSFALRKAGHAKLFIISRINSAGGDRLSSVLAKLAPRRG